MPRLHIIALGGTIASTAHAHGGVTPRMGAADIAAAAHLHTLPGYSSEADLQVTFEQLAQVGSGSITLEILVRVVGATREAAAGGASGVVLTQGTDTLEDSAFVLSLLNDAGIPIVVTGAMRNPTLPGADGPANVRAAALTALDPRTSSLRSVLVFADQIFDPAHTTKSHTTSPDAFVPDLGTGPLGWVSEDRVFYSHLPADRIAPFRITSELLHEAELDETRPHVFGQVALVEVGMGESLALLDHLVEAGYSGAVIAGVGGGHVPTWAVEAVGRLASEIPVVYASRTGGGTVLERTYGYPGAELDLLELGLVPAGTLSARRARLLLMLALHFDVPPAEAFAPYRR